MDPERELIANRREEAADQRDLIRLAEIHASRRLDRAAYEHQAAEFAGEAARLARSRAEHWLEVAAASGSGEDAEAAD